MATTNSYSFEPGLGEFVIDAYGNCGIRRTELSAQHMQDARFAANLINSRWTASGINLWAIDLQTTPLISGQATYSVDISTIFILDAYITTIGTPSTDRLIFPLSRSDYAAIANKDTLSTPTSFWFNRLDPVAQTITLWAVPNATGTWTLNYYRSRQIQDAELAGGLEPEVPFTYLDAYSWELSARLAIKYAPDKAQMLKAEADEAWANAVRAGTENVGVRIIPEFRGYYG